MLFRSGGYGVFPGRQMASSGVLSVVSVSELRQGAPEIVLLCHHDGMRANLYTGERVMIEVA